VSGVGLGIRPCALLRRRWLSTSRGSSCISRVRLRLAVRCSGRRHRGVTASSPRIALLRAWRPRSAARRNSPRADGLGRRRRARSLRRARALGAGARRRRRRPAQGLGRYGPAAAAAVAVCSAGGARAGITGARWRGACGRSCCRPWARRRRPQPRGAEGIAAAAAAGDSMGRRRRQGGGRSCTARLTRTGTRTGGYRRIPARGRGREAASTRGGRRRGARTGRGGEGKRAARTVALAAPNAGGARARLAARRRTASAACGPRPAAGSQARGHGRGGGGGGAPHTGCPAGCRGTAG
jgi:hypothetical protein